MSTTINEATFQADVLQSPLPVIVHFWAPWCGLCRIVSPLLNRFQDEWGRDVRVMDVNADENLRLANLYRLTTLPTLLFFEQGTVTRRIDTFRGKDDLRLMLDSLMRRSDLALTGGQAEGRLKLDSLPRRHSEV